MQKVKKSYLGIDVSKEWFDLCLITVINHEKQTMECERFENSAKGLKQLDKWLDSHEVSKDENSFLVIENTGVYHRLIYQYCSTNNLPLHIGNAAQIKWSLGITRGKDDVTDSKRLANYCYKNADELKPAAKLDENLQQLKDMFTARERLLKQKNSIRVYLQELKKSNTKEVQKLMEQSHQAAIEGIKKSLDLVEAQIKKVIKENEGINHNYKLLKSVPGIGHVTAIYIICCTNNFVENVTGKQLASYAGVAPFAYSSGTSIKGKNKVHKMGNKSLKKLLFMGARSVVQHKPEFKQYYERKEKEGKHHLAILNAIQNKILLRAAAVINNQKKYVDKLQKAA